MRRAGRVLERERLRHELADDHRERGEREQDDRRRGRLGRVGIQAGNRLQQRRERRRERRLSVGAEDQARERDADLRDRDVAIELVRVLDDRQDPGGQGVAVLRQPPQPAAAGADGGELRGHVQARQQDEKDNDERCHQHLARRSYPNRLSSTVSGRSA